jgi:hypothetical protein
MLKNLKKKNNSKVKRYIIDLLPYSQSLILYVGNTYNDALSQVEKDYSVDYSDMYYATGLATHLENKKDGKVIDHAFVVCLSKDSDVITIFHEALHITWYLFELIGIKLNYEVSTHEVQTYMQGYIAEQIMKYVKPKMRK